MSQIDSNLQTARILASFIRHSSKNGQVENPEAVFNDIGGLFLNGNLLELRLFELNEEGIVSYDQIGEDGFKPLTIMGCTDRTSEYLAVLLEQIEEAARDLQRRLREVLTFDPEKLRAEIASAETQLSSARKSAQNSELLRPLLNQISSIETHFRGVAAVADKYEEVYKNIIRPVQLEGESGVKATVRWAIIGIVASTVVSIVLGNWKDIVALF